MRLCAVWRDGSAFEHNRRVPRRSRDRTERSFTLIEQRQKVGMLKIRRNPDLAQESLRAEYYADFRQEQLESNAAVCLLQEF